MKIISSEVENCFGCSFCERGHGKYLCDKLGMVEISNPSKGILENCPLPDSTEFVSRELFDRMTKLVTLASDLSWKAGAGSPYDDFGNHYSTIIKEKMDALRDEANGKKVVK